ncbi:hypothetical protein [Paenibacillus jamilae]|uniref:hypothetical protein n=1 Tax=Paenibacillus jamilae TaxID=114136 RepID=UPI0012E83989|nr:hypothetical protein [Paenibacillus jamilae]
MSRDLSNLVNTQMSADFEQFGTTSYPLLQHVNLTFSCAEGPMVLLKDVADAIGENERHRTKFCGKLQSRRTN